MFLHGNMTYSFHYEPLTQRLKDRFHCIAVDLRGFGDSSYHNRFESIDELAEDVAAFMERKGIEKVFTVGWSERRGCGHEALRTVSEEGCKAFSDRRC